MSTTTPTLKYESPNNKIKDNENILEIINDGINRIILNIKQNLGGDYNTTNTEVTRLIAILNGITNSIDTDIGRTKVNKNTGKYEADKNMTNYNVDSSAYNFVNTLENQNPRNITDSDDIKIDDESIKKVQNRLDNCQNLEHLYLIKHAELMKTFAFSLNLYDKYKYTMNTLLYILKNLVNKNLIAGIAKTTTEETLGVDKKKFQIKLPKTVIPSISTLLSEQKAVQDIITNMETQMNVVDNKNLKVPSEATAESEV
jgi:hypothetical protein